jgi:2C-methyl-D-erythritol 2,4-cyclodiphosphate synthase
MKKDKEKKEGVISSVSDAIKGSFSLDKFKKSKNLSSTSVKFKETRWIPLSQAFQDTLQISGIPLGHITLLRGHSDTGKTTALLEAAVSAQSMGILPVFIITEMKWSWEHAKSMGLKFDEVVDETTGEVVDYSGFFIYVDREKMNCVEDVSAFIADILDEQKKENLPYNICFFWDSVGSIPCRLSIESNSNNNEWNAGAMSQQFGNFINQRIIMSRKESQKYTNTLVAINKVWVAKPEVRLGQPKMQNKGGNTMWFDASLVLTFGNITNAGTNKINASKNGKTVEFAKRTRLSCDKNHITGVTAIGKVIMTVHGFINDDKKEIESYKKTHAHEWLKTLGTEDFDLIEEPENSSDIFDDSE